MLRGHSLGQGSVIRCQVKSQNQVNKVHQVNHLSPVQLVERGAEQPSQGVGEALPGRVHLAGRHLGEEGGGSLESSQPLAGGGDGGGGGSGGVDEEEEVEEEEEEELPEGGT